MFPFTGFDFYRIWTYVCGQIDRIMQYDGRAKQRSYEVGFIDGGKNI